MRLYETQDQYNNLIEKCPYYHCGNAEGQTIIVYSNEDMSDEEVKAYISYSYNKFGKYLREIALIFDGDDVEISYGTDPLPKFERIRRVTGYLAGTLDRFNDAKKKEVEDRIKHRI